MTKEKSVVDDKATTLANATDDGSPKFGRLLLVLLSAVALIVVITFATEAYYGV